MPFLVHLTNKFRIKLDIWQHKSRLLVFCMAFFTLGRITPFSQRKKEGHVFVAISLFCQHYVLSSAQHYICFPSDLFL